MDSPEDHLKVAFSPESDMENVPLHVDIEKTNDENYPIPRPPRTTNRLPAQLLRISIILLAAWAAFDLLSKVWLWTRPTGSLPCYCGTSIAEAKSLGCEYVAMASSWLPPACRDKPLEREFEQIGTELGSAGWAYYSDYERTQLVDSADVAARGDSGERYYTSWQWHVTHCFFYWRKLQRAQYLDFTLEPVFNSDGHIHHCARVILGLEGPKTDSTTSGIGFGNVTDFPGLEDEDVSGWRDLF